MRLELLTPKHVRPAERKRALVLRGRREERRQRARAHTAAAQGLDHSAAQNPGVWSKPLPTLASAPAHLFIVIFR